MKKEIKMSDWTQEETDRIVAVFELLISMDKKQNPHLYNRISDNNKNNQNCMNRDLYYQVYTEAQGNAVSLLNSARKLFDVKSYPQSYALAYTALEEISKSQFSADVYSGLRTEKEFRKFYTNHNSKISFIGWAHDDATSSHHKYKWIGPDIDDIQEMNPDEPLFQKRNSALYIDIDFDTETISKPIQAIGVKDAEDIIHVVEVALERIWEVSNDEFGTGRIGTKAFIK